MERAEHWLPDGIKRKLSWIDLKEISVNLHPASFASAFPKSFHLSDGSFLFKVNSWQFLNPGVISKLTRENNPLQLAIPSSEQMDF